MACKFQQKKKKRGRKIKGFCHSLWRFPHSKLEIRFENPFSLRFFYFPYLLWQITVAILRISYRVCLLAVPLKIPLAAHVTWPPSCLNLNPLEIFKGPPSAWRVPKSNGKHVAKFYLLCKSLIFQAVYLWWLLSWCHWQNISTLSFPFNPWTLLCWILWKIV